jgi:hypothetical protein
VIELGTVVLVPAGGQAPAGRRLAPEDGRLSVGGDAPADDCWVAADDAQLVETDACGLYLLVDRATRVQGACGAADLEPGVYQVIRRR